MVNFEEETKQLQILPFFKKEISLDAGGKISDDAEVIAFANKTVPVGKKVIVRVELKVISLKNE